MKFIKNNLFVILLGVTVIIVTILSVYVIFQKMDKVVEYEKDVKRIIETERSFTSSPYALLKSNEEQAQANLEIAEEKFVSLISELNEKYPAPEITSEMTALKFKRYLRQVCIKMENLLRSEDVWIPDSLKWFSYDNYMKPHVLPTAGEIKQTLKQLEIIQELIYVVAQSEVTKFEAFRRVSGHKMEKRDLYDFMPFSLSVTGTFDTVQHFTNMLYDAKYFFMVRNLDLSVGGVKMKSPPNFKSRKRGDSLSKDKRMAYSDEAAEVKISLTLDYFEFHDKE